MFEDDRSYLQQRAEAEVECAQRAKDPCAVKAHYQLAEAYLDRLMALVAEKEVA